jgi:hypothetical protein
VRIDLTGATLCVPAGVTLASGRGFEGSAGGELYVSTTEGRAMLRACGDGARVTGLRLHGSEPTECPPEWPSACEGEDRTGGVNCRDCMPRSVGIQLQDVDDVEVDNCELTGWTYGAVNLVRSMNGHVHHNHIHHNQRQGLGYGVVLSGSSNPATALIEHNRFDYNRHSVAGSGADGQSYEARNNLVLGHANGHVFDMHGVNEALSNGSSVAGTEILVHGNTVLPTTHYALVVRGRPTVGSYLYSNCLARSNAGTAALQRFFTGNFYVDRSPAGSAPNQYGRSGSDCETTRFCFAPGGAGPITYLTASSYDRSQLAIGDFDGDGRADIFRTDGTAWWWLSGGRGSWERRNTSSAELGQIAFGDFDGDGSTDVFHANGSEWRYSRGGSSPFERLNSSSDLLASMSFGDFDGDGKTDAFRATGTEWQWSPGAARPRARLSASTATADLVLADFDGDGRTDVFTATGTEWRISSGGTAGWETIGTSSFRTSSLRFADIDGDGRTDILHTSGHRLYVSWAGRSRWEVLTVTDESIDELAFGDFDGDGRTDLFRTGCY